MRGLTRRAFGVFGAAILLGRPPAWAQQPSPLRIRGRIEKVDGNVLTISARNGRTMTVTLADDVRVGAMVKASLADIKPDSFIGVTAMPQFDGSQKAIGLHIFMDSQKGVVPERHMPWDREPGSTMTNATVDTKVASLDGDVLTVKYKDGEKKVIVPPDTPVVAFTSGSRDDIKPGAMMIIMGAQKRSDGSLTAASINVGRDGAAPPM